MYTFDPRFTKRTNFKIALPFNPLFLSISPVLCITTSKYSPSKRYPILSTDFVTQIHSQSPPSTIPECHLSFPPITMTRALTESLATSSTNRLVRRKSARVARRTYSTLERLTSESILSRKTYPNSRCHNAQSANPQFLTNSCAISARASVHR